MGSILLYNRVTLLYRKTTTALFVTALVVASFGLAYPLAFGRVVTYQAVRGDSSLIVSTTATTPPNPSVVPAPMSDVAQTTPPPTEEGVHEAEVKEPEPEKDLDAVRDTASGTSLDKRVEEVPPATTVPFFSQFTDISKAEWRTVGCGIASLAMLIDYYKPGETTVDDLLDEGIASDAFLDDAGWIHQGLVDLAKAHGLTGEPHDLSPESMSDAFAQFSHTVENGPVMASVHYTFEPTNPIPHLVVITGIDDDTVYYNDPSEPSGNGSISAQKFKASWKQKYIAIRPRV